MQFFKFAHGVRDIFALIHFDVSRQNLDVDNNNNEEILPVMQKRLDWLQKRYRALSPLRL